MNRMSDDLISRKALSEENVDKVRVSSAEIVVHGTKEKPYYEIEYFDLSDNEMHVGFSSYKLDVVFRYLEKYFDIVNEKANRGQSHNHIIGDLISRKAVLCILTEARVKDSILCSPAFPEILAQRIRKLPTAFDKGKVLEELKKHADIAIETNGAYGSEVAFGEWSAYKQAEEIVKKGGIE